MTTLARWFCYTSSIQGRSHIERGLPCQDASIATAGPNDACLVICDGAGSAARSELGAQAVTQALHAWLPKAHAELVAATRDDAAARICHHALEALQAQARAHDLSTDDLACTLAFASIQGDSLLVGNLGDGLIGAIDQAGQSRVMLGPLRGEHANTTVFLTSPQPHRYLALGKAALADRHTLIAMTDGAAASLLKTPTMTLSPAIAQASGWFLHRPPAEVRDALDTQLLQRLHARTRDDCTLTLARRIHLHPDDLQQRPRAFQQAFLGMGNAVGLRNRWRILNHLLTHPNATPLEAGVASRISARTAAHHMRALNDLGFTPQTPNTTHPSPKPIVTSPPASISQPSL